ncbi:hypothetical protein DRJ17_07145 [Candidatus Woesearchaeota archaeon]|nr:MAG: hypothetical protein DRJ17_07145 [Candidatus Woesearchaeota archaeon]
MDKFIPLDIPLDKVLEFAENRPLELFKLVRNIIENEVGQVYDVEVYEKYFDPKDMDIVIEYFVKCSLGELSLKIIYSRDPMKTLNKYYDYEKSIKSRSHGNY